MSTFDLNTRHVRYGHLHAHEGGGVPHEHLKQLNQARSYIFSWLISFLLSIVTFGVAFVIPLGFWIWGMVAGSKDTRRWNTAHGIVS